MSDNAYIIYLWKSLGFSFTFPLWNIKHNDIKFVMIFWFCIHIHIHVHVYLIEYTKHIYLIVRPHSDSIFRFLKLNTTNSLISNPMYTFVYTHRYTSISYRLYGKDAFLKNESCIGFYFAKVACLVCKRAFLTWTDFSCWRQGTKTTLN